uniref:Uncharacterized protein n=1 Tax=Arundo donax TaxID=35708 RepID=A0A0A9B3P3_ARUDO
MVLLVIVALSSFCKVTLPVVSRGEIGQHPLMCNPGNSQSRG